MFQLGIKYMELDFGNPFTDEQTMGLMNIVTIIQQISGMLPGLLEAEENTVSRLSVY